MKKILLVSILSCFTVSLLSQKVDSIFFNLYTDSLKKGQHNYINVDGKLNNGRWVPLTAKDISFSCTAADFSGNELIIPADFSAEKVTVKAVLKANPAVVIEKTIWIKQNPDPPLPGRNEIMATPPPVSNKKNKKKSS